MKLELSIHASGLRNVAGAFKGTSDPFAVVTKVAIDDSQQPEVIGRTEVIKNTLSPEWVKVFDLEYDLGKTLKVAINIFDEVRKGSNKAMGSAVFDIGEVLGARGNTKAKRLKGGGNLYAHVRKSEGSGLLRFAMKGIKLKNFEGFMRKSDPFFELSRKIDSAGGLTWDNVFRSEVCKNNLNPEWKEAVVDISKICGGDLDKEIRCVVFDHEGSGKHVLMGEFETSVNGLLRFAQNGHPITMTKKKKETGTIVVTKAVVTGVGSTPTDRGAPTPRTADQLQQHVQSMQTQDSQPLPPAMSPPLSRNAPFAPGSQQHAPTLSASPYAPVASHISPREATFVDYVSGGCELSVAVAIDFTGSNGDPRRPGTLHHLAPDGSRNDYEKAIAAVVSILEKYDSDRMFPVYGFGAKYDGIVRHCFQCGATPEHKGVAGVLEAYRSTFRSGLIMSGPTVFSEVIQTAASHAKASQEEANRKGGQAYTILLILTDGAVTDPNATAAAINQVSDAPLSIVIVGIGNADFGVMRFLDDMNTPGKRDIVQFLSFREHCHSSEALTSETLDEIPAQLEGYFRAQNIAPLPPLSRTDSKISIGGEDEEIDLRLDITDEEIVVTGGGNAYVDGFNAGKR